MREAKTVGPRLRLAQRFLVQGAPMADIGAGDGDLVQTAVTSGDVPCAIATEYHEGAFRRLAERMEGQSSIEVRRGFGLRPIQAGEVSTLVLCGMGTSTLLHILRDRLSLATAGCRLVLGPMKDHAGLRRGLTDLRLAPVREAVAVEGGRPYVVMVVEGLRKGADDLGPLGPILPALPDPEVDALIAWEVQRRERRIRRRPGGDETVAAELDRLEAIRSWRSRQGWPVS